MEAQNETANKQTVTLEVAIDVTDPRDFEKVVALQDMVKETLRKSGVAVKVKIKNIVESKVQDLTLASVNGVILPPAPISPQIGFGMSEYREKGTIPRRQYLYDILKAEDALEDVEDTDGVLNPHMMRGESYHLIDIPKLKKQVLVCDEEGQATFISDEQRSVQFYLEQNKLELQEITAVHRVVFRDIASWRFEMRALLTGKGLETLLQMRQKEEIEKRSSVKNYPPSGNKYYSDKEKVKADLIALAEAAGVESFVKLNTGNIRGIKFRCTTGKLVRAETYLIYAGMALWPGYTYTDVVGSSQRLIITELLELVGVKFAYYPARGRNYYSNPGFVRRDLERFAQAAGLRSYEQFNTTYACVTATCLTGQTMTLKTYLSNGGIALKEVHNSRDAASNLRYLVDLFIKIANKPVELHEMQTPDAIEKITMQPGWIRDFVDSDINEE